MATVYSSIAANRFTNIPRTRSDPEKMGIPFRVGETFTLTTDHDSGDIIAMLPIRSNWAVRQVLLSTDGAATTGAANIGLYTADADGVMTAVDADVFASAQALTTALTFSDVTGESGVITLNERYMPIWEAAGLTEDPNVWHWVCLTLTANIDATNIISLDIVGVR